MGQGGKSGGGDASNATDPSLNTLLEGLNSRSTELFDLAKPLLNQAAGGVSELLSTGGTGAQIPAIQQALAASRAAGSTAVRQAQESTSRMGVTGTDYASTIANLMREGEQTSAGIPAQMSWPVISNYLQSLGNAPQTALQGLGSAAGTAGGVTQQALANESANSRQVWQTIASIYGSTAEGASKAASAAIMT